MIRVISKNVFTGVEYECPINTCRFVNDDGMNIPATVFTAALDLLEACHMAHEYLLRMALDGLDKLGTTPEIRGILLQALARAEGRD